MSELPLGWQTDLAVQRILGSQIEAYDDHVLVRSPTNPRYHWGNFVLVTDRAQVDDAAHWLDVFTTEFPDAEHRAIGLPADPDPAPWVAEGLEIEHDDVLASKQLPPARPLADGYVTRALTTPDDWEQSVALGVAEYGDEPFIRKGRESRAAMVSAGETAWFGAFHDGTLVSELGIVDCGDGLARYQSVLTRADHRRHGLTSHLLGVAAGWAGDRGVSRWVIMADQGGDASRLYQAMGFAPAESNHQAYRAPA